MNQNITKLGTPPSQCGKEKKVDLDVEGKYKCRCVS